MMSLEWFVLAADSHQHVLLQKPPELTGSFGLVSLLPHPIHRIPIRPQRNGWRIVNVAVTNPVTSCRPVGVLAQPRDHAVFRKRRPRHPNLSLLLVHRWHQLKHEFPHALVYGIFIFNALRVL